MTRRGHKGTSGVMFTGLGAGDQDVCKWRKFIKLYTCDLHTFLCVHYTSVEGSKEINPLELKKKQKTKEVISTSPNCSKSNAMLSVMLLTSLVKRVCYFPKKIQSAPKPPFLLSRGPRGSPRPAYLLLLQLLLQLLKLLLALLHVLLEGLNFCLPAVHVRLNLSELFL